MSELLTLARAARSTGIPARWLKSEAQAGRLPCLEAGGRVLFDQATLTECLRVRAANGTTPNAALQVGKA